MRYLFLFLFLFVSSHQRVWSEDSLNDFLVAKPHMPDIRFKETVIYMLYHNNDGAVGLVINKPLETMSINKFFESSNLIAPEKIDKEVITLYWGGPVESNHIFFIHSSEYKSKDFIFSNKNFTVTRDPDVLYDIVKNKGPKNYLILKGISSWHPGQLDFEIQQGDWDKKSNSYIPLFNNGNELWGRLNTSQDI